MKKLLWVAAAFVAGFIVSQAATTAKADTMPYPGWIHTGACFIGPNNLEAVYEIHGTWVRTTNRAEGEPNDWRNLAVTPTLRQMPDDYCRRSQ